jgi:hypothetical protein
MLLLATLGAQARCGAAAASPSVDKNVRRFISYPLFAVGDDRGNVDHLGQDCQEKDIVCANQLHADALARENTIQETP